MPQYFLCLFSRVATKSNSSYNMMNVVRTSGRTIWSKWNLVHTCLVVRGRSLLILRIVGQRSRSQLLKKEQKFDTFFVSARYLKNEMSDLNESWYTHAWWWEEEAYWYWGCRSKVKVTLCIHMFATQLLHLWFVTDFFIHIPMN